jgi:signal peptidase I
MKVIKLISWVVSALLGLALLGLGLIYILPGFDVYTVRSNSMQPVFSAGDVIIVAPPGFLGHTLKDGQIITYQSGENVISHRIVAVDGGLLTAQGDANKSPDPAPVDPAQVKGVFLFSIPSLGYVTGFVGTRQGWFLSIVVPGMLLVIWLAIDIFKETMKLGKEETSEPEVRPLFLNEKRIFGIFRQRERL